MTSKMARRIRDAVLVATHVTLTISFCKTHNIDQCMERAREIQDAYARAEIRLAPYGKFGEVGRVE